MKTSQIIIISVVGFALVYFYTKGKQLQAGAGNGSGAATGAPRTREQIPPAELVTIEQEIGEVFRKYQLPTKQRTDALNEIKKKYNIL